MAKKKEKVFNSALVTWARSLYGDGKRYSSGRKLAKAAGRNVNAVNILEDSGEASAELLIDLARAAGTSPTDVLAIAGYLTNEEIGPPTFKVTEAEQGLIQEYRELPVYGQDLALGAIRGMRRSEAGQEELRLVAENQGDYQAGPGPR